MYQIGGMNKLRVAKITDKGYLLRDDEEEKEILMSRFELPEGANEGDDVEVFLYPGIRKQIMATTMRPYLMPGEFGYLPVDEVSASGALLDWGLSRPLFLPSREMRMKMFRDKEYLVYAYLDVTTEQIIATTRIEQYLDLVPARYDFNEEVDVLIAYGHDLGYRVIVNNSHWGMIYSSEIFGDVRVGDKLKGYVKGVREDGRVDVALQKQGYAGIDPLGETILKIISESGGRMDVSDRSSSEEIAEIFGCSKKSFKKALGGLFRDRKIEIHEDYVCLADENAAKADGGRNKDRNRREYGKKHFDKERVERRGGERRPNKWE